MLTRTIVIAGLYLLISCRPKENSYTDWSVFSGGKESIHYSSLTEIDTGNVSHLQVAWTFHTHDADTASHSQIQCNPIIVDSILYATSPKLKLFALNAATGKQLWVFNPQDTTWDKIYTDFILNNNRGVTYWTDGKDDKRILYTAGSYLFAVNALTGKLIPGF